MVYLFRLVLLFVLLLMGACATAPKGPSVLALPGTGKSLDEFRADDMACRQYALGQTTGTAQGQAANESAAYLSQRQYDFAYLQCMYARGHRIPVPGGFMYYGPGEPGSYTPPPPAPPNS